MNLNLKTVVNQNASRRRVGESATFCVSVFPFFRFQGCRGFTLAELMVAAGLGSLVLAAMAMVFVTSARSFVAMGDYASMNGNSRNALDRMSREIRRSGNLTGFSSTSEAAQLQFLRLGMTNSYVIYQWDADSRQLTEWITGRTTTNVLLTECDELAFTLCKNTFAPTTDVTEAKAINASWNCSRTTLGKKSGHGNNPAGSYCDP